MLNRFNHWVAKHWREIIVVNMVAGALTLMSIVAYVGTRPNCAQDYSRNGVTVHYLSCVPPGYGPAIRAHPPADLRGHT